MPRPEPNLLKTTGVLEPFREHKLRAGLQRSGASRDQIERVIAAVRERLREAMPTREIYGIAHGLLRHERRDVAARYSLQRAIQRLGPDGFPFEKYVAELWRHAGYRTLTGVVLPGRFVRHEVDLVAVRGRERILGECKFKVQREGKVDVKVPLYVQARAEDLGVAGSGRFWLITNGRFTTDARTYGEGVGLRLLGWDHPRGDGLRERIDRARLHPVTVLSSLRPHEHDVLLRRGIVLCATLRQRPRLLEQLRLSPGRAAALWQEIEGLCGGA
jgi:hypothetical protein